MDLASIIGFLGTLGMIAGAMISAGGLGMYIDVPSILIVFGGSGRSETTVLVEVLVDETGGIGMLIVGSRFRYW